MPMKQSMKKAMKKAKVKPTPRARPSNSRVLRMRPAGVHPSANPSATLPPVGSEEVKPLPSDEIPGNLNDDAYEIFTWDRIVQICGGDIPTALKALEMGDVICVPPVDDQPCHPPFYQFAKIVKEQGFGAMVSQQMAKDQNFLLNIDQWIEDQGCDIDLGSPYANKAIRDDVFVRFPEKDYRHMDPHFAMEQKITHAIHNLTNAKRDVKEMMDIKDGGQPFCKHKADHLWDAYPTICNLLRDYKHVEKHGCFPSLNRVASPTDVNERLNKDSIVVDVFLKNVQIARSLLPEGYKFWGRV